MTVAFAAVLGLYAPDATAQQKREAQTRQTYTSVIDHSENGKRYKIRLDGSKILELEVDGKEIPESEYSKYEPMVKKIIEQAEEDRAEAEKHREEAEVHRKEAEKHREEAEEHRAQAQKDRVEAEQHRKQADENRKQAEVHRKQAEVSRLEAEKHREQAEVDRKNAEESRERASKDREQAEEHRKQADKERAQAEIHRQKAEEDRKLYQSMIDEIVSQKLVESKSDLKEVTLDEKEFIINNVKQPDAIHSSFKAKYLKDGKGRIRYSNSGTFRGLSVD